MSGLTKRQKEILDFIRSYIAEKEFSPSFKEIGDHFGFSSLGSVYNHLKVLKRKGLINAEASCARSLKITKNPHPSLSGGLIELPLVGYLLAGFPIETFSLTKMFKVPINLVKTETPSYLLQIKGDSLIEEAMLDGDIVIVKATLEAEEGDTVIALINDHDTLVKRYYADPPYIRLESTNPHVSSLIFRENHLKIQGIITGLLRNYLN